MNEEKIAVAIDFRNHTWRLVDEGDYDSDLGVLVLDNEGVFYFDKEVMEEEITILLKHFGEQS